MKLNHHLGRLLLLSALVMPPETLHAADWEVRPIQGQGAPFQAARAFIAEHHYSGGSSKTAVYVHGLYRRGDERLCGVAFWLPPTKVAAQSVNRTEWRKVISLSRLVVHPDVPTNGATFLMARSIRLIRQDRRFVSLVTYADEFMEHSGAIYRATNWTYVGTGRKQPRWEDAEGRQVSNRATTTKTKAQREHLGLSLRGHYLKHKFIMHLWPQQEAPASPLWWFVAAV